MKNQVFNSPQGKSHVLAIVSCVSLVLLAYLSISRQKPPAAVPADATDQTFSSARALKHVAAISKERHPIGSAQHDEVREYILNELRSAGLTPEIQRTTAVNPHWGEAAVGGTVQNILARLPGTGNTKAILLMGHYDAMANSLGAADDSSAIGVMLETLRALKASARLKNDAIFLFTDGEEVGQLGAIAFVKEHPWAKDVGLALNFEARGSSGPSLMFETSDGNGLLINEFAKAAPYPVSSSLFYDIYRVLPNDTDLTPLKRAGVPGLNFAFIDDAVNYHSANDRIGTIDERSVQHHGSYALALSRHFGNLVLENRKEHNAVYFNIFGAYFVHYSVVWVLPLLLPSLVLFTFVVVLGLKRKRLTFWGMVLGGLFFFLCMIVSALMLTLIWWLISRLHAEYDANIQRAIVGNTLYMIGLAAFTVSITSLLYAWFSKKVRVEDLFAGALFCWLLLCLLTGFFLPGGSYLFTWPLLFMLPGFGYVLSTKEQEPKALKISLVCAIFAIPGIVMFAPMIHTIFIALSLSGSGVVAILMVLLLGLLIPLLSLIAAQNKWLLPGVSGLFGGICILFAGWTSVPSKAHPRPDNLFYCLNADTGQALWASVDPKLDEWTSRFFRSDPERERLSEFLPQSSRTFLKGKAPSAALEAPRLQLIDERKDNGTRTLQLRLTLPRDASMTSIFSEGDAELAKASVNGKPVLLEPPTAGVKAKRGLALYYYAPPQEGIELTIETKSAEPLRVKVIDLSYGLPPLPNAASLIRPDYLIPSTYFVSDATLVSKSFTF